MVVFIEEHRRSELSKQQSKRWRGSPKFVGTPIKSSQSGKCACVNHRGNPKMRYKSKGEALSAIIRKHSRYGEHSVYRCKQDTTIFHITSKKN